jgi:fibro-slime domain-containing protein
MSRLATFVPRTLLLVAVAAVAACGARSSLPVPPPPDAGLGGAGGGGGAAMSSSSAASTGGGCQQFPALPMLVGTVRDFSTSHPDFEKFNGDDRGMLETTLGDDGEPVYAHPDGTTPTTTGKADFDEWYHDTPAVNVSAPLSFPLVPIPGGLGLDSDLFFPIDNQLLGNEGDPHNFHFTYEAHIHFRYTGGEVFRFSGDDDLWAFIDRRLVIDLGGVHSSEGTEIAVDDLGLTPGETYPLDVFFAERHTDQSHLHVDLLGFDLCE